MESFIKKILTGKSDQESHRYFIRFGKGDYNRRFLISLTKGNNIKIRASFELANDLVKFVKENSTAKFSGRILSKSQIPRLTGKRKAGTFVYEIQESSLEEFENAYFYLLNADSNGLLLKIKSSLPKPGKNEEKIDNKFCSLDADEKHWQRLKEVFFWDIPECKKASIQHNMKINEIILPKEETSPEKIRELAKRKGTITRIIKCDGKETKKDYPFEA